MILGSVNTNREASVRLVIVGEDKRTQVVDGVINTGYTGELMIPATVIQALRLPILGVQEATLGNDERTLFETYSGAVIWDGTLKDVEIIASKISALVGMSLLEGYKLEIEGKPNGLVRIEQMTYAISDEANSGR